MIDGQNLELSIYSTYRAELMYSTGSAKSTTCQYIVQGGVWLPLNDFLDEITFSSFFGIFLHN